MIRDNVLYHAQIRAASATNALNDIPGPWGVYDY